MSSKRDPKIWIGDILDSIQEIEDTIGNVEAGTFLENHVLINAVSYALLKISEATKHLLQSDIELPSNEPWTDIYSLGNQLRHGYFGIDHDQIWHMATQDLPSLKATCEALLKNSES
jgi:uncharacterized protein with HEPN domain